MQIVSLFINRIIFNRVQITRIDYITKGREYSLKSEI